MKNILKKIDFDLLIWIITIIELILCVYILIAYNRVYKVEIFGVIILLLPILHLYFSQGKDIKKKISKIVILIITILLPIVIMFTLPKYTYNEGKKEIQKEIGNMNFVKLKNKYKTISSDVKINKLFIRELVYFYKSEDNNTFIVNPISGEIMKEN